jgi:DNA-binding NarL/FixJ family response regulator
MDVNLADEQGLVVTQAVTALVGHPVVVVTSTDNVALSHAELTACGARAFVSKDRLAAADLQHLFSPPDT